MKQFSKVLAALTFIVISLVGISCTKTNEVVPVVQPSIIIEVGSGSSSVINKVTVAGSTISDDESFPLTASKYVSLNSNVSDTATVSLYLSYVKGETIFFVDSYGNARSTTFDGTSDKGYVSFSMPVGYGTQQPFVYVTTSKTAPRYISKSDRH